MPHPKPEAAPIPPDAPVSKICLPLNSSSIANLHISPNHVIGGKFICVNFTDGNLIFFERLPFVLCARQMMI